MIVDALERSWRVWADFGAELDDSQWQRPTRLPGWTVKGVYAHHSPFPSVTLAGIRAPGVTDPITHESAGALLAHMQQPGGLAEQAADVLRDTAAERAAEATAAELVAEFTGTAEQVVAELRAADLERRVFYGGFAVITAREALRIFVLEAVVHYFDMAAALQRELPGPMAGAPVRETTTLLAETADPVALIHAATGRTAEAVCPVLR